MVRASFGKPIQNSLFSATPLQALCSRHPVRKQRAFKEIQKMAGCDGLWRAVPSCGIAGKTGQKRKFDEYVVRREKPSRRSPCNRRRWAPTPRPQSSKYPSGARSPRAKHARVSPRFSVGAHPPSSAIAPRKPERRRSPVSPLLVPRFAHSRKPWQRQNFCGRKKRGAKARVVLCAL